MCECVATYVFLNINMVCIFFILFHTGIYTAYYHVCNVIVFCSCSSLLFLQQIAFLVYVGLCYLHF